MSKKFELAAKEIADEMRFLAITAIRKGVEAGLTAAIEQTYNDSSNAAVHWQVGMRYPNGRSRHPASTKLGKGPLDFRLQPTTGRRVDSLDGTESLVGKRGSNRGSTPPAVQGAIIQRETEVAIGNISGAYAPQSIYFYNSVGNISDYSDRAWIQSAGAAALAAAKEAFDHYMNDPAAQIRSRAARRTLGRKV